MLIAVQVILILTFEGKCNKVFFSYFILNRMLFWKTEHFVPLMTTLQNLNIYQEESGQRILLDIL